MAIKFGQMETSYLKQLLGGKTVDEIKSKISETSEQQFQCGYLNENGRDAFIKDAHHRVDLVAEFATKIKPVPRQTFAVDPWGYEQTNYENVELIGQVGATMLLLGDYETYAVAKFKFTRRETAHLGNARSTSWEPAYSNDEMTEANMRNAYSGH